MSSASSSEPLKGSLARAAFEAATECLIILNAAGVVEAVNPAFERLYELSAADVVGQPFTHFANSLTVERMGEPIGAESWVTRRALNGESVAGVVQTIRNIRTGHVFTALCGAKPHFEDGRLVATIITVEDVTEATLARQRVEAALSAAEVGIWWADLANQRLWGDANFAKLYGLTEEEVQGGRLSRAYELMHPEDRDMVTEVLREAAWSGEAHEIEFRTVSPQGVTRWLLSRGRSERDAEGTPIRRMGSVVDVSRQKLAESAYRGIAEAIPQIVWTTRADGYHDYFNQRWYAYTGIAAGLENGWAWKDYLHPEDFERTLALWTRCLATGEPYEIEYRFKRYDGVYRWFLGKALPIRDEGSIVRWFGTLTDIQDQKEAEEELERRVLERTAQLEAARRSQESWNYSVSHDLRAPLRAIMSTSRILQLDHSQELTADARELLERQAAAAKKLGNLIDELLQTSRLANQDLVLEQVDLSALAAEAFAEQLAHWGKAFEFRLQAGMAGFGDPRLVELIYTNYIENAMKYSDAGTVIEAGVRDGAFFVRDEGMGFEMQYEPKVWRPFERIGPTEIEGTGIGLYNVAQMVERMGGRVWAESELGKGSTFWFTLTG